jgi:transposase
MLIIGLDYHPSFQQIAFVDTESGECGERRLMHGNQEAANFYREVKERGVSVRVGMEATGHARWFERLMTELGFELWIGDPAQIKAKRVRKQKTDRQDAQLILTLLIEDRFPKVWVPSLENRDLRQLLWHRHRLVQMRTRLMNQLQAVALNEGVRRKKGLWSKSGRTQLESFLLAPWATKRRKDLLDLLDRLTPNIAELSTAIEQEGKKRPEVVRLMTHPGVGPLTGLAFVLIIGMPERFRCGKQIGSCANRCSRWSELAAEVCTSGDAARTQDRESSDGAKAGYLFVLDVAQGMELSATLKVRFARGTARKRPWCEVDHRLIDWASRSP